MIKTTINHPVQKYRPTMLAILDGWGLNDADYGNAVLQADTPHLDRLFSEHPHTTLRTSGLAVGLPEEQMGNSEAGHLNIGAGRVVYQSLTRITKSITDGDFFENPALLRAASNAVQNGKALHVMGLIGPGGVHSHRDHLVALLQLAQRHAVEKVYIHAWLDGRDTPPRSADDYLAELEDTVRTMGTGQIVTISGRYYAMDRDKRWERVEKAYDAITIGNGLKAGSAAKAIQAAYARGENDEFVLPTNIVPSAAEPITIEDGDSVIFFNFRPDRARELTRCFVDPDFDGFERTKLPKDLIFVTMTEYEKTLPNVLIAYPPEEIVNTLGAYISKRGLSQLRIAETEKYAHVTFFFNGQTEAPYPGEARILIPSPKVATYDLQPEMSAYVVCEKVLEEIDSEKFDLIILNFANMDMVGHTGILEAAVKAVEAVDRCVGKIVEKITSVGGQILITADHGNSEAMLTEGGEAITAHSLNPVPLILIRENDARLNLAGGGALADLAPTLLDMMELPIPTEMTGRSLLLR
ncbi:MAG: 2,3-bisphosphoglycerate-independent phosphoglycerate mutase [Clostridiales Family XIII bacterium]|jgi:2,3-bisphosphoglycerate-independent phosphoglycerate mutase|nr:2,3-bisphosphoglycerate-independent phosphoglycerate mutase [Clostridiales Family XIII bacterium]